MARAAPVVGHEGPFAPEAVTQFSDVRFALLGGSEVGGNALLRAYVWHCIGIPVIFAVFVIVHFWRVRKDGGISGPL
jgi:quinol-cytochrome oxidoreductase complex cytochrome b subunit